MSAMQDEITEDSSADPQTGAEAILQVRNLRKWFPAAGRDIKPHQRIGEGR